MIISEVAPIPCNTVILVKNVATAGIKAIIPKLNAPMNVVLDKILKLSFEEIGIKLKETIETQIGINVAVGIANSKMLAKLATHKAKLGNGTYYIEEKNKTGYKCQICGFIYEGDISQEPDDFVCPICKQPKKVFEKI